CILVSVPTGTMFAVEVCNDANADSAAGGACAARWLCGDGCVASAGADDRRDRPVVERKDGGRSDHRPPAGRARRLSAVRQRSGGIAVRRGAGESHRLHAAAVQRRRAVGGISAHAASILLLRLAGLSRLLSSLRSVLGPSVLPLALSAAGR